MQFTVNPVFFTSGSRKLFHSFTVFQSCYENLPNDEQSKAFATPDFPRYSMCHGHMNAVNLHNTSSTLNPQPGAEKDHILNGLKSVKKYLSTQCRCRWTNFQTVLPNSMARSKSLICAHSKQMRS